MKSRVRCEKPRWGNLVISAGLASWVLRGVAGEGAGGVRYVTIHAASLFVDRHNRLIRLVDPKSPNHSVMNLHNNTFNYHDRSSSLPNFYGAHSHSNWANEEG